MHALHDQDDGARSDTAGVHMERPVRLVPDSTPRSPSKLDGVRYAHSARRSVSGDSWLNSWEAFLARGYRADRKAGVCLRVDVREWVAACGFLACVRRRGRVSFTGDFPVENIRCLRSFWDRTANIRGN